MSAARLILAAALVALAGCASVVRPVRENDARFTTECPDPTAIYSSVFARPACWTDEEWESHLRRQTERLQRQYGGG